MRRYKQEGEEEEKEEEEETDVGDIPNCEDNTREGEEKKRIFFPRKLAVS